MAAGVGLVDTSKCSLERFEALWNAGTSYLLFECLDDSGGAQGLAVGRVLQRYRADTDGAFLKLEYIAVTDPYYQHWVETEGSGVKFHHICRSTLSSCKRKVGGGPTVHIQKIAFLSASEVGQCLKEWKVKRLDEDIPVSRRKKKPQPMEDARDEGPHTAAKSKARHRHRREGSPGVGQEHSREDGSASPESQDEDLDVGRSNVRQSHRDARSPPRRSMRPERARGTVGASARSSQTKGSRKQSPLDVMLEEDDLDPAKQAADKRLDELPKSLDERKRKDESRGGASAVLATRVQQGLESNPKRRKKESERDKVQKALKVLSQKSRDKDSTSSGFSEDDEEEYLRGGKDGDLLSRQKKLKKLSADKPGVLLMRGFSLMHEQLGTLFGDTKGSGSGSADDVLQPAAVRYLLSSALPLIDLRTVGEEKVRELRTLAMGLDMLVSGKISGAGDLYMQRFKSILMGIRDKSSAASRYLELIPMDLYPTASSMEETDYARHLAAKKAKSDELLAKVAVG